jgi:D-serine deaminase-like pyridoxal phosphate-dependent protein
MRIEEEHEIFTSSRDAGPRVGDVVELLFGYAPVAVNRSDAYHNVEDERAVDIWPVIPTSPGQGGMLA